MLVVVGKESNESPPHTVAVLLADSKTTIKAMPSRKVRLSRIVVLLSASNTDDV